MQQVEVEVPKSLVEVEIQNVEVEAAQRWKLKLGNMARELRQITIGCNSCSFTALSGTLGVEGLPHHQVWWPKWLEMIRCAVDGLWDVSKSESAFLVTFQFLACGELKPQVRLHVISALLLTARHPLDHELKSFVSQLVCMTCCLLLSFGLWLLTEMPLSSIEYQTATKVNRLNA